MRQMMGCIIALSLGLTAGVAVSSLMIPIHLDGEWMLVDRICYGGGEIPARGDRIIIENAVFTEHGDGGRLARRVAAVAGDRVRIQYGRLQINGEDAMDLWPEIREFPEDMEDTIVEKGHVFVLCDDGGVGLDSRSEVVGQIPEEEVWGRVIYARKESEPWDRESSWRTIKRLVTTTS